MRYLTAFLLSVAVAAGFLVSPAQAASPQPGTCFSYSSDQWLQTSYTPAPVDCSVAHNGEVLGQVTIPSDIAATGFDSASVKAWAFQACQTLAVDYVWSSSATPTPKYPKASFVLPRSARLNVQLPTADEWGAGEAWAACLGQSRNVKLTAPQSRVGSVKSLGLKPYVCMNPRNWKGVDCKKRTAVRFTNQVWMPTTYGEPYPGTRALLAKTAKACNKMRLKKWSLRTWYVPGLAAWDRGNKFGFCEFLP